MNEYEMLGKEVKADFYGVDFKKLDDIEYIESAVANAISSARMTLVQLYSHKFSPVGVTTVAVLAESHLAVHTWPEIGFCSIDIYTCGERGNPHAALQFLIDEFKPLRVDTSSSVRGNINLINFYKNFENVGG